jgi:hypothetical protein
MSSISFDPMALQYDETMGYPPGVAERVAGVVQQTAQATRATSFLELAMGTGRLVCNQRSLERLNTLTYLLINAKALQRACQINRSLLAWEYSRPSLSAVGAVNRPLRLVTC